MNVNIKKSKLKGTVFVPASKSYSHRYLLAAMLTNDKCEISNLYFSNDIIATLNCMSSFGCTYLIKDNTVIVFNNEGNTNAIFDCNESGSTLRFLIPIALSKFDNVTFKGSKKLISRGIEVYEKIFNVEKYEDYFVIKGKLQPGVFDVDGSLSSQYITGLLFALPTLNGDSIINIIPPFNSKNYVDMTLKVLSDFGIKYEKDGLSIKIFGNQQYVARNYIVEGDYSNAAFLEAFNYLNHNVTLKGLDNNSLQGDKSYKKYFELLNKKNATIDISNSIDLAPVLMAFASIKHGCILTGTNRLKIKESDRANSMKEELSKVGVNVEIYDDYLVVYKSGLTAPISSFDSHNDHRIAMALSMFCSMYDIKITNAEAVNKSYPTYFIDLEKLGGKVFYE